MSANWNYSWGPIAAASPPMQRAEVAGFAGYWRKDATGGVIVDRPVGAPNERAANDSLREVVSILAASGIPHQGSSRRPYQAEARQACKPAIALSADDGRRRAVRTLARRSRADLQRRSTTRTSHIGTSAAHRSARSPPWSRTRQTSCSRERKCPAYTAKRNAGIEKWRKGESPPRIPDPNKGMISELSK